MILYLCDVQDFPSMINALEDLCTGLSTSCEQVCLTVDIFGFQTFQSPCVYSLLCKVFTIELFDSWRWWRGNWECGAESLPYTMQHQHEGTI